MSQKENIEKFKQYLKEADSCYFKNNKSLRKKVDLASGQICNAMRVLKREGILEKVGDSKHHSLYKVNRELL